LAGPDECEVINIQNESEASQKSLFSLNVIGGGQFHSIEDWQAAIELLSSIFYKASKGQPFVV
jgi:hypothetical protein